MARDSDGRFDVALSSVIGELLVRSIRPIAPDARVKRELLLLAEAPVLPLNLSGYVWREIAPGVRLHHLEAAPRSGITRHLVWGAVGAVHPRHRHDADEVALVLQGRFRAAAAYGPGDICRSRAGSIHTAEFFGTEDCVCYVLCHTAP
jgi:anti-sigma factor ChrR (cupin superfamily)